MDRQGEKKKRKEDERMKRWDRVEKKGKEVDKTKDSKEKGKKEKGK